jgi:hypothetical protein
VRGENDEGFQSLAPGAAGQMSRTTTPSRGVFSATGSRRPVFRSTPVLLVMWTNGVADSTSPDVRSITYT